MKRKTAKWMLVSRNVSFSRMIPKPETFVADVYECSCCHNKANNHEPLPETCFWCKADMRGEQE